MPLFTECGEGTQNDAIFTFFSGIAMQLSFHSFRSILQGNQLISFMIKPLLFYIRHGFSSEASFGYFSSNWNKFYFQNLDLVILGEKEKHHL